MIPSLPTTLATLRAAGDVIALPTLHDPLLDARRDFLVAQDRANDATVVGAVAGGLLGLAVVLYRHARR